MPCECIRNADVEFRRGARSTPAPAPDPLQVPCRPIQAGRPRRQCRRPFRILTLIFIDIGLSLHASLFKGVDGRRNRLVSLSAVFFFVGGKRVFLQYVFFVHASQSSTRDEAAIFFSPLANKFGEAMSKEDSA